MTLGECLKMEYDLVQKFLVCTSFHLNLGISLDELTIFFFAQATPDFFEGVDAVLVRKPREKPKWQPAALSDISAETIDKLYFSTPSPNSLRLRSPLDFKEYPYQRYSLPSENEVRAAVFGESSEFRNSGGIASTDEAVRWFKMERKKKKGVEEKIRDILSRKTIVIDGKLCWQASL